MSEESITSIFAALVSKTELAPNPKSVLIALVVSETVMVSLTAIPPAALANSETEYPVSNVTGGVGAPAADVLTADEAPNLKAVLPVCVKVVNPSANTSFTT